MKPVIEFICLKCNQVRVGKRAYLIPLVPNENGVILPRPIHIPPVTKYFTKDHFETADTIYVHYTGTENPFVSYTPSHNDIIEGEYTQADYARIKSFEVLIKQLEAERKRLKEKANENSTILSDNQASR